MKIIYEEFEKSPGNPHDAAFKLAFRNKKLAKSFIRDNFPEYIVKHIDFRTLETTNKSFVDEQFRESHSDLIYKCRLKGKTAFLYMLLEHQSSPDRRMPFRMLCYVVNLLKDFEDQNPETKNLPVVFPVVFYHGKKKWNSPLSLKEMIEGYDDAFEWFIPDFSYKLFDLSRIDDDNIVAGPNTALAVVLHLFKYIFDDMFENTFKKAADLIIEIDDQKMLSEILEWAVIYSIHARNEDADQIIDIIVGEAERIGDEKIKGVIMTAAEQLRQKGIEEGKIIGEEKGIIKGQTIGIYTIIIVLLEEQFKYVPDELNQMLKKADAETLNQFARSILKMKSLKDAEDWWREH